MDKLKVLKELSKLANFLDLSNRFVEADLIDEAIRKIAQPITHTDTAGVVWTKITDLSEISNDMMRRKVQVDGYTAWRKPNSSIPVFIPPGKAPDSIQSYVDFGLEDSLTPVAPPVDSSAPVKPSAPELSGYQRLLNALSGKTTETTNEADDDLKSLPEVIESLTEVLIEAGFEYEETPDGDIKAERGDEHILIRIIKKDPLSTETGWNVIEKDSEIPF